MMRLNTSSLPSDCFAFRLSGLPCYVCVTHYLPEVPANLSGHPDRWSAPEGGEIEYEIYDRTGYRAKWLEDKVTIEDEVAIFEKYEELKRSSSDD